MSYASNMSNVYYRIKNLKLPDTDSEIRNILATDTYRDNIMVNYNSGSDSELLCINYSHNSDVGVYRIMKHSDMLQHVFTVTITYTDADTEDIKKQKPRFYSRINVCTTSNPNIYVLHYPHIHKNIWVSYIYCIITLNDKVSHDKVSHDKVSHDKVSHDKVSHNIVECMEYIRIPYNNSKGLTYTHTISMGSSLYILKYHYDINTYIISTISLKDIKNSTSIIHYQKLLKLNNIFEFYIIIKNNIQYLSILEQTDELITLYDINTKNNDITTQILKKSSNKQCSHVYDLNGNHIKYVYVYDFNRNCFRYISSTSYADYPNLVYIIDDIIHSVIILSVYTILRFNCIKFITYDIVLIMWNSMSAYYYFNREHFTLTPLYIFHTHFIKMYNDTIIHRNISSKNHSLNVIPIYKISRISNAERDTMYTILDEYLPPELCDMVWAYYVHNPVYGLV